VAGLSIMLRVLRPIEPVEPRMAMRFMRQAKVYSTGWVASRIPRRSLPRFRQKREHKPAARALYCIPTIQSHRDVTHCTDKTCAFVSYY